ncbi:DUF736 family protein [Rhizobium sp. 2YAF20]|uniref:DUF736 family protein n=1 Tax=Rhizobium sp. 2YAF20 TaxID=3233027 RepID=UPI003F9E0438
MATIGSFTASGNGFNGTIKTLNLNVKATIRAVERATEKGPDFRILAGNVDYAKSRIMRSVGRWILLLPVFAVDFTPHNPGAFCAAEMDSAS